MAVQKRTITVPIGDSLTVEFVYDGVVVAEAQLADVLSSTFGSLERTLEFLAGPVSVDGTGERHGADDGGEGWHIRALDPKTGRIL